MIKGFNGQYRFLSNFYPIEIEFEGLRYPSVEHAYQAAKTLDFDSRHRIALTKTASEAKSLGQVVSLRPDWDDIKLAIMKTLLRKKFYDAILMKWLLETKEEELEETNYWHDQYWGNCICRKHENIPGQNCLGNLLMETRELAKHSLKEALDDGVVF